MSKLLCSINQDTHVVCHYPSGYEYDVVIPSLMESFALPKQYNITYEYTTEQCTVSERDAAMWFGAENEDITWFFSGNHSDHHYFPFKKKWKSNTDGPIALSLNHLWGNEKHPLIYKFFKRELNDRLEDLAVKYPYRFITIGRPKTILESVDIMENCRYVLGVEGGWTHVANAMRVPCVVTNNGFRTRSILAVHRQHPNIQVIDTVVIDKYL